MKEPIVKLKCGIHTEEVHINSTSKDPDFAEKRPSIVSFERTIERLEEGLERYRSDIHDAQIRDGLIQRFKFTYEAAHKILKRYLEYASPNPAAIDELTFQDLIRTANEQGLLLRNWSDWRFFRDMRSKTSHTYDETMALRVVDDIPDFIEEVIYLCKTLRDRLS